MRLQPGRARRRHARRREGDRRERRPARDALQLRVSPDDAGLGEPVAVARLHRRRPRGAGERVRRSRAVPPGRLGRARPARQLRRRGGGRRQQRTPARLRRRGGDREPAAARHPVRLHGHRPVGRQPRGVGVPAVRRRAATGERAAGGERDERRAAPEGRARSRREPLRPRLDPGAGEGSAPALPQRGARRRPGLRDAGLDVAARRRAPRRDSQRALLGLPGRAATPPCRDAAARTGRDEPDDGLPVSRGDLRHRALPGAAVALRARLPGADDRGRRGRTRGASRQ